MLHMQGPAGFRLDFPIPRLPSWLGAANRLSANAAIYPRIDLDFPITMVSAAVVAGALAQATAIDASVLVAGWSSRVVNLFREYCIVGARFELTQTVATTAQGLVIVFVDETVATAPNSGSLYTPHMEVPIVSNPDGKVLLLEYKPSGSYTDLEWTPTNAAVTRQWLKFFASTAQTLTAAGTTAQIIIRGSLAIAFRGYANF